MQPGGRRLLTCSALETPHFFTTLDWRLGSDPTAPDWDAVSAETGVPPDRLIRVRQVHGAAVTIVRKADVPAADAGAAFAPADIILSDDPRSALAVQSADCVPILLFDRRLGAAAAAHAGWRGLAAGVPSVAIRQLEREFGTRPADLSVAIGPSIGACCYEVGADVYGAFADAFDGSLEWERWFLPASRVDVRNPPFRAEAHDTREGRWFFDPWASAVDQLRSAGVPADGIHVARLCTASHPTVFPSYRRDGRGAGRIAAVIRARD